MNGEFVLSYQQYQRPDAQRTKQLKPLYFFQTPGRSDAAKLSNILFASLVFVVSLVVFILDCRCTLLLNPILIAKIFATYQIIASLLLCLIKELQSKRRNCKKNLRW